VAPESPGDLYDSTEIDEILALRVLTLTDAEKAEARGTDARAAAIIDRCDNMPPEMWDRLHGAVRSISPATPEPASGPDDESWYDRSWSDEAIPTFTTPASPTDAPEKLDASKKPDASEKADDEPKPWWDPGVDASADPATDTVWIAGVEVGRGSPVRLRPSHRADAHDLFLAGLSAKVAGVFRDVDGGDHIAVTLDDDPASPELVWQGRYLYFHADEIEPIRTGAVKS
jgi:hypothetical protein